MLHQTLQVIHPLFSTFQEYAGLGWSLIPVRQKVATIPWTTFQHQPASTDQLRTWFADPTVTGAAVITGSVSGIMVLDFDNLNLFRTFARQQPHFINTLTVRTRRGFHLYFRIPKTIQSSIKSLRGQGIDLLFNGRYALLSGSTVDDYTYTLQQATAIQQLTPLDIKRIQAFMHQQGRVTPETQQNAAKPPLEPITGISGSRPQPSIGLETLRGVYLSLAGNGQGRNNALFFCACMGRDHGLSCADVTRALAELHSIQQRPSYHQRESRHSRYQEAVHTIASAFKGAARPPTQRFTVPTGLPNSVRERLLEQAQTEVIRVIEGLRLKGIAIGQGFTSTQALALLKGIVGRDTVWHVLNSGVLVSPPHPLSNSYGVATDLRQEQVKKCFLDTMTKSGRSPRHRPGRVFVMPSNTKLAAKLRIRDGSQSDPLTLVDLSSSRQTRIALHRELLKRRPGRYPVAWFARRLSVSVRTIHRYHASDPLFRREMVCDAQQITWANVDTMIPDVPPHGGCFLMDGKGRQYPAKRPIAHKLLAQKRKVTYMRRRANFWWYGEEREIEPPQNRSVTTDRHPLFALAESLENRSVIPPTGQGRTEPFCAAGMRVQHYRPAIDHKKLEGMATRLRDTINGMSGDDPDHRMSIGTARRLFDQYGVKAVWRAMKIVEKRNNVSKPVGLLSVILRSEGRRGH